MDEQELIRGCIQGNRTCEKCLYEKYAGKMLSVCMRYMGSRSKAEDMVQEGFIRVFQNLDSFKFTGSLEGWIRRIMINCSLRELGKMRNKNEFFGHEYYSESSDMVGVISKMSADEIHDLIAQLPDGYRTVFNMYVIDGYSHKEIADQLDFGVGTSRSQLAKARNQLREMLQMHEKIGNESE
ncbi:MAG TPA: sigma-70 family RNA polymerase sigma factor [Saprospiraceae bacterium]|nr:sigma-70 family RNA polymerase sigma factor [Saprospiraceae bacterium]